MRHHTLKTPLLQCNLLECRNGKSRHSYTAYIKKSGEIKEIEQAFKDNDWVGTFNLWVVTSKPEPAILYQVRSLNSSWEPGKFDVSAGGFYTEGEERVDGLREVEEELGKTYAPEALTYLGRRLNVSLDTSGLERKTVVDVSVILDDSSLDSYIQDKVEVHAIALLPIEKLLKVHTQEGFTFDVETVDAGGVKKNMTVSKDSFPYNWDNYHFKMVLLIQRFLAGEKHLMY